MNKMTNPSTNRQKLTEDQWVGKMSSRSKALVMLTPIFSLFLLFQNCAPAAQIQSRELASDGASAPTTSVPMTKVLVHLEHDSGVSLSDVELVADDVVRLIDQDPTAAKPSQVLQAVASNTSPSSYNLELPLGTEKIIVARAKVRDAASNVVSTYYGNAVVTLDESVGDITIQMIAVPQ